MMLVKHLMLSFLALLLMQSDIAESSPSAPTTQPLTTAPAADLAQMMTAPETPNTTAISPAATPAPRPKLWNLQDADIVSIINEVSQETGKNFIIDPRVQGKITLISSKAIKSEDTYDVFLSILGLLGYSAIPSGDVVKIIPNIESPELATRLATNKSPGKGDEVVVRVIPLEHTSANQLITILRPLLPQWSNVAAYSPGNVLILVGRAANIERLIDVIHHVDTASDNSIDVVALHQSSAMQVTNVLNNLQNASRASGEVPTVFAAADERSNSVLLSGNKSARLRMRLLIAQLDTPSASAKDNTEVIYLRYLVAKNFAPILGKIAQQLAGKIDETIKDNAQGTSNQNPVSGSSGGPAFLDAANASKPSTHKAVTAENLTNIQAEPSTNALILIAPPSLMRALKSIVAKLDVRPAQVHVEAIIVELAQNDLKNFGIQWGSVSSTGSTNLASGTNTTAGGGSAPFDFPPPGAGTLGIIPHQQIQAVLNALENTTGADILSTPSIVVLDNQKANLSVGQDIPEQTGSYATTGLTSTATPFNTVGRKSVSLILTVTPQINLGTAVRLAISITNDSLQNPQSPGLNPIINTSKITNSVIIESGDILVIGGLTRNNLTENIVKVPILGDIPVVGKLFQNKSHSLDKRYLMVFIKPVILHTVDDAAIITNDKYAYTREKQQAWPEDLNQSGVQKLENVLPPLTVKARLPTPFEKL